VLFIAFLKAKMDNSLDNMPPDAARQQSPKPKGVLHFNLVLLVENGMGMGNGEWQEWGEE
jgi:hypothetical protein